MVTDVYGKFWEVWKRLVVLAPGYDQFCNDGFKLG